jgi:TnpA family transposase
MIARRYIYSHVSDRLGVYGTQVISCAPREATYVIYGHIRRSCTGFLTIGSSNADRLRAGLDR